MTRERVVWQNPNFMIIDGEKVPQDTAVEETLGDPNYSTEMADGVMARIKREPTPDTHETVVEYVGPKRLPRITRIDRQNQPKDNTNNILGFHKRKK